MSKPKQDVSKRQEKAERILMAAAELVLRWGYNNTTMDEIARRAGIAKGTLYLYWKTREDLFRALMIWERVKWTEDFIQRISADLASMTLGEIVRHSALALMKRPLLKAVMLRDVDVLGKLVASQHDSNATLERLGSFNRYLHMLRELQLVRTDLSPQAQAYAVSAIFVGYLMIAPMVPDELNLPDEEVADLIAETVRRTLEPNRPISADELQPLFAALKDYVHRDLAIAQRSFEQELE